MTQSEPWRTPASMASASSPVGVRLSETSRAAAGIPAPVSASVTWAVAGFGVPAARRLSASARVCFKALIPGSASAGDPAAAVAGGDADGAGSVADGTWLGEGAAADTAGAVSVPCWGAALQADSNAANTRGPATARRTAPHGATAADERPGRAALGGVGRFFLVLVMPPILPRRTGGIVAAWQKRGGRGDGLQAVAPASSPVSVSTETYSPLPSSNTTPSGVVSSSG